MMSFDRSQCTAVECLIHLQDCRDQLRSQVSELEREINGLLDDGVSKLHHRLSEVMMPQYVSHNRLVNHCMLTVKSSDIKYGLQRFSSVE